MNETWVWWECPACDTRVALDRSGGWMCGCRPGMTKMTRVVDTRPLRVVMRGE